MHYVPVFTVLVLSYFEGQTRIQQAMGIRGKSEAKKMTEFQLNQRNWEGF